jgi:hypothetical protein
VVLGSLKCGTTHTPLATVKGTQWYSVPPLLKIHHNVDHEHKGENWRFDAGKTEVFGMKTRAICQGSVRRGDQFSSLQ